VTRGRWSAPVRGLVTLTLVGATCGGLVATPALAADGAPPATYTVPNPPLVDAVHGIGTADATYAPDAVPADGPGGLHPLTPTRLVDTRTTGKPGAGAVLDVPVAGQAGLPAAAVEAAVVTLTVTNADAAGFVTAWPCDAARPEVSNVNFTAGATVANLATVALGAAGDVCLFTSASAHLVVDVSAWYGAGDNRAASVVPTRIADTRTAKHKLAAGEVLVVQPTVARDVPATGVKAVALNVTATEPERAGFLTVYPCDQAQPLASNVNYVAGHDTADAAVVGVAAGDGTVCVYSSAPTHVVVDINGWFGPLGLARFSAQAPQRLMDTRATSGAVAAGGVLTVKLPDALAGVATVNVTVTGARGRGYVTAFPCGTERPMTSNLNFASSDVVANAAVVPVGAGGAVCLFTSAVTNVVVDLNGTFVATYGTQGTPVPGSALPAIQWGFTQVGKPYAAINPYRFGDSAYGKPWACDDGSNPCTRIDMHGTTRTYPAGTFVYDCSGFVTAAWLRAGVDLVKLNAAWTDAMLDHLAKVDVATARLGDIVLFDYSGGGDETNSRTDHAGMFLTATTMLQAGSSGVSVATIDWKKVVALVRPAG
jgi:cell wall-associated NlpC family hydrolase